MQDFPPFGREETVLTKINTTPKIHETENNK